MFVVSFIPHSNFLSSYFCFTQFGGSFRCLNFDKAIQQQQLLWSYEYMKIIYENCGVKSYMKEDHRSCRRNFCSCEKKAWKKKFRLVRASDPWPLRYRCSSLPFELTSLACCCFRLSDGSWYVAYSFYPRLWFCYDLGLEWTRNLWQWGWNWYPPTRRGGQASRFSGACDWMWWRTQFCCCQQVTSSQPSLHYAWRHTFT